MPLPNAVTVAEAPFNKLSMASVNAHLRRECISGVTSDIVFFDIG